MFCPKCGQELADQARFCTRCGANIQSLTRQSSSIQGPPKSEPPVPAPEPPKPELAKAEPSSQNAPVSEAKGPEGPSGNCDNDRWTASVGKNQAYYIPEFQKIQSGGKSHFNWAAFLFGPAFCFYRRCGDLFKKFFLVSTILLFASALVLSIGGILFSFTLIAVGGIIETIAGIWQFVNMIRLGKQFNRLYFERCSSTQEGAHPSGTSVKAACLFCAVCFAVSLVIGLGSGVAARLYYSSLVNTDSDTGYMDQWDGSSFSDDDTPEENRTEDYQADDPQFSSPVPANIPSTSQNIEYTDFIGEFNNIEPTYGELNITWEDFTLCIDLYEYDYSGSVLADSELSGNSFTFEAHDPYNRVAQSIKLTYIPAADSPYGADTLYAEFLEPMNTMEIFTRSPNSNYFNPYEASEPSQSSEPSEFTDANGLSYSEYNLYLFEGTYTDSEESVSITLSVLPDETGFECELFWYYGRLLEQGTITPGAPSLLSEGTIVTIGLDPSLNIHVLLEGDDLGADYYEMDMSKV